VFLKIKLTLIFEIILRTIYIYINCYSYIIISFFFTKELSSFPPLQHSFILLYGLFNFYIDLKYNDLFNYFIVTVP